MDAETLAAKLAEEHPEYRWIVLHGAIFGHYGNNPRVSVTRTAGGWLAIANGYRRGVAQMARQTSRQATAKQALDTALMHLHPEPVPVPAPKDPTPWWLMLAGMAAACGLGCAGWLFGGVGL